LFSFIRQVATLKHQSKQEIGKRQQYIIGCHDLCSFIRQVATLKHQLELEIRKRQQYISHGLLTNDDLENLKLKGSRSTLTLNKPELTNSELDQLLTEHGGLKDLDFAYISGSTPSLIPSSLKGTRRRYVGNWNIV